MYMFFHGGDMRYRGVRNKAAINLRLRGFTSPLPRVFPKIIICSWFGTKKSKWSQFPSFGLLIKNRTI